MKTSPTERYITQGFHKQGIRGNSQYGMLEFIHNYTYEGHAGTEETAAQEPAEGKTEEPEKKPGIFRRIINYFRRIGRKDTE